MDKQDYSNKCLSDSNLVKFAESRGKTTAQLTQNDFHLYMNWLYLLQHPEEIKTTIPKKTKLSKPSKAPKKTKKKSKAKKKGPPPTVKRVDKILAAILG
ncbi:MAG: hypothetical protein ACLP29_12955 [Dissulfurispiraceae bacterium]